MVPAKPNFVKITAKMFRAQIMKYPLLSAFQNSIKGLCGIVMNITAGVLFFAVVNPIMGGKLVANRSIRMVFISHHMRIFIDKSVHLGKKLSDLITGHRYGPNRAVAFNRHQYSLFGGAFAPFVANPFFITRFTAKVFFIQLDNTAKCRNDLIARVHHLAHRMAHFPGAFLRDANPSGQNNRGYALGGTDYIIDDQQPFP